jgi:hypothetical protein
MDYQKMTVAELRELARKWGVSVPKNCKKSILIGLLQVNEPIEVEAEVIEPEQERETGELAVTFNAGQISANFDELEKVVDGILKQYDGWEPSADSAEDVAQCARERKYLNGLAKQIDERRKDVKNKYLLPLTAFEARANAIRDKVKEVSARINSVEQEAEDRRKSDKKAELREHYEAYAGLLVDVVPYDKLHDDKWLNKTFNIEKAKAELESKVDGIAKDWETLKSLNLEFHEDAEARFFETLDVGGAISWAGKLAEDKRRIEAMKAELAPEPESVRDAVPPEAYEPEIEYEQAPVTCEADEYAPPHPVYAEPAPIPQPIPAAPIPAQPMAAQTADAIGKDEVIADIAALLRAFPLPKLENLRDALKNASDTTGEVSQRVMVIDGASQTQMQVIGKFCGLVGVTGTFKNGTLAQVVAREQERAARAAREGMYQYGA